MRRAAWIAGGAIFACSIGAGCVLVTGSTSGYQQADSGTSSLDAACTEEGGCLELSCLGATECGDAGVCCLALSGNTLASSCQAGPCQIAQLCTTSSECSKGTCAPTTCTSSGVGLQFQSCGAIPGCN